VRLRVTPARALAPELRWEAWLAASAGVTKDCDKQTLKLTQPQRLIPADRRTCARCRPVFRGAAIPSIDAIRRRGSSIPILKTKPAVARIRIVPKYNIRS
jgi:hypothetical protein